MPQDAFHIRRLATELNTLLTGGKINRVAQINKDELVFTIYTGKTTVKLLLSTHATGARVCLTTQEKEPLAVAPNFCMLLRKHLQNAEILSIKQAGEERIIQIEFYCTSDFSECKRTLICEIMGKYSNLILTENGVILGALKTTSLTDNSHRILFSGAKYLYPTPQDKISPLDGAGMRSRLENYLQNRETPPDREELSRFVFDTVSGFAQATARELVKRAKDTPLWVFIPDFFQNQTNEPHLLQKEGVFVDFFAFPVENGVPTPSLCKAEDIYYSSKETAKDFLDKKRKLESAIRGYRKKACKRLQDILERLTESEKADENRIKGELLTANLYRLEKGMKSVTLENWYDEKGGEIKIALDETLSPSKNAAKYFKLYNKQKRAKEVLLPMKEKEESEIKYTDSVLFSLSVSEKDEDLKEVETELVELGLLKAPVKRIGGKKQEKEIPYREYEYKGYRILAGRNNLQNDRLLREASKTDIWLHAQKYHSAHLLILTDGEVPDEVIKVACEICAYYSEGKDGTKIPVDYCQRKCVKKPNKAKAGFVVYENYKTALAIPNKHEEYQK